MQQDWQRSIGVLGGMGPRATVAFVDTLLSAANADRDQGYPHIVVDCASGIPDRSAFLLGKGEDPKPAILASARRLERAGADVLVMPCNTAHAFADDLRASTRREFVDWITTSADYAKARNVARVGILATPGTLQAKLYERAFEPRGMTAVTPGPTDAGILAELIYRYGKGRERPSVGIPTLLSIARRLVDAGSELLMLACTELPLVLPANSGLWPCPALDPADAVARRCLELAAQPREIRTTAG